LSAEVLEEIRLLTNLETSQQKLLQIVLAGQPELDQKLDSYELRQLKQRVALRCHLDCLSLEETSEYIQRRLRIAGANGGDPIFGEEAIAAVHLHSKGIPRLINTICENSLLSGYAKQEATLSAEVVRAVAGDLRLGVTTEKSNGSTEHAAESAPEGDDLLRAVKMLLEVRNRMQQGADVKEQLQ
jgi:general secretion pathway protein A